MHRFLRYRPSGGPSNLEHLSIADGNTIFAGDVEYQYRDDYPLTKGIRKGLQRFIGRGLLPDVSDTSHGAVVEVQSNNILPALNMPGSIGSQFVKFRGGTKLAAPPGRPRVDLLVGQCLFGVEGNRFTMPSGRIVPMTSPRVVFDEPLVSFVTDDRLSIYEIESIERQSAFINALVRYTTAYASVTVCLPRVGYYLHTLKPYQSGALSPDMALAWFDAVDRRFQVVTQELLSRLVVDVPITIRSPLAEADTFLRTLISNNRPILLASVLEVMSSSDALWQRVLTSGAPRDLYQLKGDFSDAVEELRVPPGATTRVVVKGPREEGALELGDELSRLSGLDVSVVAMYPLPQVVAATRGDGLFQLPYSPSSVDVRMIAAQYA